MVTLGKVAGSADATSAELAILEEARGLRAKIEAAEARMVALAAQWAALHPAEEDGDKAFPSEDLPAVDYRCTASFALNAGLSDSAGTHLIHEALELKHRLPGTWARLHAGGVQAWRARRVAERTIHQSADIAALIDDQVTPIAHKIGPITLDRLINEAKMRLYPVETERAQLAYLDRRHVRLFDELSSEGVATIEIRADLKDAYDFDGAVSEIATILGDLGNTQDFDVRRALAIGILADPQAAADLLSGDADATTRVSGRKQVRLFVHVTPEHFTGLNPVARLERTGGQPILERQVRDWCGRSDTHLKITPVIDLADEIGVAQYEVPDRLKQQIQLRDLTCVFPHCTRPARRADHDHITPYNRGGATNSDNLAALCRRHHRVKTHAGWRYLRLRPRTYLWLNQFGRCYVRDHQGTTEVIHHDSKLSRAG